MVNVREERENDSEDVRRVNEAAFGRPAEADLIAALRSKGAVTLSLVVEKDGRLVGHILLTPVTITAGDRIKPAVALGPMAVLPDFQGQGIGSRLINGGMERLRAAGHERVIVLGHPTYYPRFGFVPASRFGIRWEHEVPDEVFMALPLRPEAFAGLAGGTVAYEPEFGAV